MKLTAQEKQEVIKLVEGSELHTSERKFDKRVKIERIEFPF